ncbi:MAG TPA: hypothetical protein VEK33_08920, partial [Terriglobales bacterium]|nr:hypothetical protein [Terriglobales bacterium]
MTPPEQVASREPNQTQPHSSEERPQTPEIVTYRVGSTGYTNVERYDEIRYLGEAQRYKQQVMANAYKR